MYRTGKRKRLKLLPQEHIVLVDFKVTIKRGFSETNKYQVTNDDGWCAYTTYHKTLEEALQKYKQLTDSFESLTNGVIK